MSRREIQVIPFKFPGIENIFCYFTTRRGGEEDGLFKGVNLSFGLGEKKEIVKANRDGLLKFLQATSFVEVTQVHGDTMVFVDEEWKDEFLSEEADAMATHLSDTPLLIKVADCQPLLLSHRRGRAIAALHVGWRANRGNFIQKWVKEFCGHYGFYPHDVFAVRGPSLGPCHSEFINFSKEWGKEFVRYYKPLTRTVDLWQMTKEQLIESKIPEENIFSIDVCTYCCAYHFFSYRREGATGRQGGIIIKKS